MASLCKKQQCTIERRGFRQELDSWRHKLIHCVGFESILEGLFGSGLLEDLTLFKDVSPGSTDCEPEGVSDWSFDENCLFCCLRRDKVKEHLVGLSNQGLESGAKPLLVKDQIKINRLEKQAEEFLSAVLYKKDVPSFSDLHIPVVAREIMQRMIRQFAAEYTSKNSSSSQDIPSAPSPATQPHSDQSLPPPPSLPPAASLGGTATSSVPSQNPVLSKLLMADQDSPLDLTVKKLPPQPVEQDGVLDLSLKKGWARSSMSSHHSPHLSQMSTLRGRSLRADGQAGLPMRSLQDGRRRENFGHSAPLKPTSPLGHVPHIKLEVNQDSDTELSPNQNYTSRPFDHLSLSRYGSPSWASKTHFGALLKLRANSGAGDHLKDLPSLLEAAGLFKSPSCGKAILQARRDQGLSLSHSPPVDLKIPQVRGLGGLGVDLSWGSLSSDSYSLPSPHCENSLGKRLRSILPKHGRRGSSGGLDGPGRDGEYWGSSDADRPASGGQYPTSDPEADLCNKQPRKKRGRYRQYNTELLEEAIEVVMGGKMSVSKAQTVYGIPHSTLEYKVKERLGTLKHLPKKKLKLMSHMEELEGMEAPEGKEALDAPLDPQESLCEGRPSVSVPRENGRELLATGLSPDK
ncbi:ligand-dependent corepressor isoform X3 [Oncorhynchus tshawytscha]|uniref:ligand-dependent corepressor isoform X3 n=1 Tax=Oncorhynchus tshawytscha TaxID=74940 RepID=UPI000D0A59EF|nr:ligand-dependent corepressor isoform X3 [Oncorhynchus tshawytscha]